MCVCTSTPSSPSSHPTYPSPRRGAFPTPLASRRNRTLPRGSASLYINPVHPAYTLVHIHTAASPRFRLHARMPKRRTVPLLHTQRHYVPPMGIHSASYCTYTQKPPSIPPPIKSRNDLLRTPLTDPITTPGSLSAPHIPFVPFCDTSRLRIAAQPPEQHTLLAYIHTCIYPKKHG